MKFEFIYDSYSLHDRKLLAYAQALHHAMIEIDVNKEKISRLRFADLVNRSDVALIDFINHEKAEQIGIKDIQNLSDEERLKVMEVNPKIVRTPIMIYGQKVTFVKDIASLNLVDEEIRNASKSDMFQQ